MAKKIAGIVLLVVVAIIVFAMGMRRASMMNGSNSPVGSLAELTAVTKDGDPIQPSAEVEAVTGKLSQGSVAQKVDDMIVILSLNPYPSTMRQPTDFDVKLTDAAGKTIDDATVTLNLTMPSMWMPPNQPALDFVSDGQYHTSGQFTMRGWWRVEVVITRGGQTQSAFFDLGL
jgi:hypothetical protein